MKLLVLTVFSLVAITQCAVKLDCVLPTCIKVWSPQECFDKGQAWVPADCDHPCTDCKPITEVITKIKCDRPSCKHNCKDQEPKDCKAKQVLVPKDGYCWFCNKCVDRSSN